MMLTWLVSAFPGIAFESHDNISITSAESEASQVDPETSDVCLSEVSQVDLETIIAGNRNLDLQRAAMKGNWGEIERLLDMDQNALTADISGRKETVLFTAVLMGHADVVEKLLDRFPPNSDVLEKQNIDGETVLHVAAAGESLEIVQKLVNENPRLTQITNIHGNTPLMAAVGLSNGEIVRYLCEKTRDTGDDAFGGPFSGARSGNLITNLIYSGHYDVALTLLQQYPKLAITKNTGGYNLLSALALKPSDFKSGSNLRHWELWIYHMIHVKINNDEVHGIPRSDEEDPQHQNLSDGKEPKLGQVLTWIKKLTWKVMKQLGILRPVPRIKEIEQDKLKHRYSNKLIHIACKEISKEVKKGAIDKTLFDLGLYQAAENGIVEIITICLQQFPTLVYLVDQDQQNLFHRAIKYRREKILNLLYEKTAYNKMITTLLTESGETCLHVVAKLAPYPQLRSIPCPAIQMQREIQWFKAIEKWIPSYQRAWTKGGQTADQLFTTEHKTLVEESKKWMKDTSNLCMLVSTLIATVVFAAAFTVPGGNLEGKGTPIFIKEETYKIFAISVALVLFSSITSILMFLSIFTARYAEQDFLYALPKRFILGHSFLFIAVAAMSTAFSSALQIMSNEKWVWFHVPVMLLGSLPAILLMICQAPLFVEMVWSTYGPSIFRLQRIW